MPAGSLLAPGYLIPFIYLPDNESWLPGARGQWEFTLVGGGYFYGTWPLKISR